MMSASKVKGLKLGAEDYMVKPFEMLELLVRIEKVLERTGRAKKVLNGPEHPGGHAKPSGLQRRASGKPKANGI